MKKIISLVLALVLCMALAAPAFAEGGKSEKCETLSYDGNLEMTGEHFKIISSPSPVTIGWLVGDGLLILITALPGTNARITHIDATLHTFEDNFCNIRLSSGTAEADGKTAHLNGINASVLAIITANDYICLNDLVIYYETCAEDGHVWDEDGVCKFCGDKYSPEPQHENTFGDVINTVGKYALEAGEDYTVRRTFMPEESGLYFFCPEAENDSVVCSSLYDRDGNKIAYHSFDNPISMVLEAGETYALEIELFNTGSKLCWVTITSEDVDKYVNFPGTYGLNLPQGISRSFYFTPSESGSYSFLAVSEKVFLDVALYNGESVIAKVHENHKSGPAQISAELQANTVYRFEVFASGCDADDCVVTISKNSPSTASALSEGSMTVVSSVACLAVGFLAAMFIFKKKPAPADSKTEN